MGTKDHGYPNKIRPCDKYDASNLADKPGKVIKYRVSHDIDYPYMDYIKANDLPRKILEESGMGKTPIQHMLIRGHGNGWYFPETDKGIGGSWLPKYNNVFSYFFDEIPDLSGGRFTADMYDIFANSSWKLLTKGNGYSFF